MRGATHFRIVNLTLDARHAQAGALPLSARPLNFRFPHPGDRIAVSAGQYAVYVQTARGLRAAKVNTFPKKLPKGSASLLPTANPQSPICNPQFAICNGQFPICNRLGPSQTSTHFPAFRRGKHGYKCQCPRCGAWVRLRSEGKKKRDTQRRIECSCGTVVLAGKHVPQICPTCRRPLAASEHTLASEPYPAKERSARAEASTGLNLVPREDRHLIIAPQARSGGLFRSPWFWILVGVLFLAAMMTVAIIGVIVLTQ